MDETTRIIDLFNFDAEVEEGNMSNLTANASNSTDYTSHNDTDDYEEVLETDLGVFIRDNPVIFSFLSLICLLTLVANALIIFTRYRKSRDSFTLSNIYSFIPCFTGVIVAIFNMPMDVYFTISGFNWFIGLPTCYFWYISDLTLCNINIFSFTVLAYIRYATFRSPFRTWSRRNHLVFLGLTLVFPTLFWSAYVGVFMTIYPPDEGDCRITDIYWISYSITFLFLILPMLFSLYMNVYTILQLHKKRTKVMSLHNSRETKTSHKDFKETKAINKLLIIQASFFLCWMPYICTYELHDLVISDEGTTVIYFLAYSSSLAVAVILMATSRRTWVSVRSLFSSVLFHKMSHPSSKI